jgi:L-arabinokinase
MSRTAVTASAPGRLDFLGGVADYSGSLVLEMALSVETTVKIQELPKGRLAFASRQQAPFESGPSPSLEEMPKWVRYVYGSLALFQQTFRWKPRTGLQFTIESEVPLSMGVSSSAALEVATMKALERFSGRKFKGTGLARLAQRAENEMVGAPCGLMDQLTCAYGPKGKLLPILCRPDLVQAPVSLPSGVIAVGWPSGVKHAVSDSPYAIARAGAFMGKAIVNRTAARRLTHAAELRPGDLTTLTQEYLPDSISGAAFIERFAAVDDPLSVIDPARTYPVRDALRFPVEENYRAELAVALLRGVRPGNREDVLRLVGELLFQSHAGYSSIGLDCLETDQMVGAVRAMGPDLGFYGARISGGGSGGTVVVLLKKSSLPALAALARRMHLPEQFIR